ncbi:MAG: peptidoglycan-binding domain-containing protein, partial [Paracoccaceae bacterium]
MFYRHLSMGIVCASLVVAPATRAMADADGLVGGVVGGVVGGLIVNEANKNRTRTKRVYVYPGTSSSQRAENREIQTALNYFSFPAGTPDGILGRRTRGAVSQYQAFMGYPVTGELTVYQRDFLLTSYHRAIAGGAATSQRVASMPMGTQGLLREYQNEAAGGSSATAATMAAPKVQEEEPVTEAAAPAPEEDSGGGALPNFMGKGKTASLASHCNKVSLLTNSHGGFVTAASMEDPNFALNEQFCLARTYAISQGEDLAARVQGFSEQQIVDQCNSFGPALKEQVAALSLEPEADVLKDVRGFVLKSGMSPEQLSGTAKICLSVGYRTDNMDVALASALMLTALGEPAYAELLGHHLSQGFGASKRPDLALAWYQTSLDAIDQGATPVFAPGQPEREALIRKAAFKVGGAADE